MICPACPADGPQVIEIAAQAGVFDLEEVDCVQELWDEHLAKGVEASGYDFLVARENERVIGFACFGPRPLTQGAFDLYWIAVLPEARGRGAGRELLRQAERAVALRGGRLLIAETSGTDHYVSTRRFYLGAGYQAEATLRDFYAPGDDLVIFTRHLDGLSRE